MKRATACAVLAFILIGAGPLSKFDDDAPDIDVVSHVGIYDLERCLLDVAGMPAPLVYRQPDRPDQTVILFTASGEISIRKIVLKKVADGTRFIMWHETDGAVACAQ